MGRYSVLIMQGDGFTDTDQASSLLGNALSAVTGLRDGAFWKLLPDQLLELGRQLEHLSRTVYAAQVHLAGEVDTAALAAARSCPSTAALLRQSLNISAADAIGRVNTARQVLPRQQLSGPDAPPHLPHLRQALDAGALGPEHVRIIVDTMHKVPAAAGQQARDVCQAALVHVAAVSDPQFTARAAVKILERADPDGDLDDDAPARKMELNFGGRNVRTGLTPITGHLDDHGVEVVKKALDGLSAPQPAADGAPDVRSPANRRAHALVAALRGFLDAGTGPASGGEKPHLTVVVQFDALSGLFGSGVLDTGGRLSPAQTRRLLCDADIIPAVLGGDGELLDIGRKTRVVPLGIRRAVALRDRGCIWYGCDRPAGWCDAHHVRFWGSGGPTSYDNLVLLCPFHHSQIHSSEWTIRMDTTGNPALIPPKWIDPDQRPQRNWLHHVA